ncbi:MAG: ATP-grasp domain-containing protein [Oscillospiraceae bacterium]|nr:ATP-grasp domain-containing protein [Oscillospiraceae bacterium]
MKNFVFLSPNFPANYWRFCAGLKKNGMRVLGIGDCPYEELTQDLRESLHEYYKVSNLGNYDEVFRAVAFFTYKYGKIDYLESNNEFWLERDAKLRTEFNITTGFKNDDMEKVKCKSKMKAYYKKAGLPVARYHMVKDLKGCRAFIKKVGYPVVVKPDNGVGAVSTYRIKTDEDLVAFLESKDDAQYIMEEYVDGEVQTYDGIINFQGEPVLETGNVTVGSLMDVMNNQDDSVFYIVKNLPDKIREAGRKTVKAFDVRGRYVHLEFFVLNSDQPALGKKGDVLGLEVNMRPPGGISPDMENFANGVDTYQMWADVMAFDKTDMKMDNPHYYCGFCGRRDSKNYVLDHNAVMEKFGHKLVMAERVQPALAGIMGDQTYVGNYDTEEEMFDAFRQMLELK